MTDAERTLFVICYELDAYTEKEERDRVVAAATELRDVIHKAGNAGYKALALVGAEAAVIAEKSE